MFAYITDGRIINVDMGGRVNFWLPVPDSCPRAFDPLHRRHRFFAQVIDYAVWLRVIGVFSIELYTFNDRSNDGRLLF
jgi:hypothetical protein